jgi:hypothetical protein
MLVSGAAFGRRGHSSNERANREHILDHPSSFAAVVESKKLVGAIATITY